jgi:phage shock protein PspC (stress-responsive transcriptional regulator)
MGGQDEDMNELVRPRRGRWLAGVCLAVANRFGWSVALVRILAIVAVVLFGLSLWAYILLWIVIPTER